MTAPRRAGHELPFSSWLREQRDLDSVNASLNIADADYIFHRYRTHEDAMGSREVQLAMIVELKTFGRDPPYAQSEILYYHHQVLSSESFRNVHRPNGQSPIAFWHFGVFVLQLPGDRPDSDEYVRWGRFGKGGALEWTLGTSSGLPRLLRFDLRPDNFRMLSTRRHHRTREIVVEEQTPLGFVVERRIRRRS